MHAACVGVTAVPEHYQLNACWKQLPQFAGLLVWVPPCSCPEAMPLLQIYTSKYKTVMITQPHTSCGSYRTALQIIIPLFSCEGKTAEVVGLHIAGSNSVLMFQHFIQCLLRTHGTEHSSGLYTCTWLDTQYSPYDSFLYICVCLTLNI